MKKLPTLKEVLNEIWPFDKSKARTAPTTDPATPTQGALSRDILSNPSWEKRIELAIKADDQDESSDDAKYIIKGMIKEIEKEIAQNPKNLVHAKQVFGAFNKHIETRGRGNPEWVAEYRDMVWELFPDYLKRSYGANVGGRFTEW